MKIANSQRLTFQLMGPNDTNALFELDQDPAVMRFINGGKPSTMEEIETIMLPRMQSYTNAEKGWGIWKVTTLATELNCPSSYIGWILVRPMDFFSVAPKFHNLELGWRFKQMSWGKGYGTEAAKAVASTLVQQTDVTHLSAVADEDNIASINIMKKLGMQYTHRGDYSTPNGPVEVVYYQMSASECGQ